LTYTADNFQPGKFFR